MVVFHTLGTVSLSSPDRGRDCASVLAQPKRTALLAYLALARPRGFHSRDTVISLFWPESSERQARKSLNQALYFLRRRLGRGVIVTEGGRVGIGAGALWCDALELDRRLERGEPKEALELYGGELLPAFFPTDSAALERWLDEERSRFHARALAAALELADACERRSYRLEEVHWLRRAREYAPYDERLAGRLVERLIHLGDRTGALRELDEFGRRLKGDLGIGPSPRLHAEARRLIEEGEQAERVSIAPPEMERAAEPASASRTQPSPETTERPGDTRGPKATDPPEATDPREARDSREIPESRPAHRSRDISRIAAGLLIGVTAAFAGAPLLVSEGGVAQPDLDSRRLLVADFANATGDPDNDWLGGVAAGWIAQELQASGLIDPIPSGAVARDLRSRPPDEHPSEATDLAASVGAGLAVTGSYYALGDSLEFHTRVVDVASGRLVRSLESPRISRESPLGGIDRLRREVTAALATAVDPRLAAWADASSQPPDLEAYRLYSDGLDAFFGGDPESALDLLRSAASRDSGFTAPLIWAAQVAIEWGRQPVVDSVLATLAPRRNSLHAWDRAMLDYFEARLRGTVEDVRTAASRLVDIAPGSEWLLALARANLYANRPSEALRVHDRIDPARGWLREWPYHWQLRSDAQHRLGRYEEELEELSLWREALPHSALVVELRALAALGRTELHATTLESALTGLDAWSRADLYVIAADELEAHGHRRGAHELRERAVAVLGRLSPEELTTRPGARARILYRAERWTEARAAFLATTGLPEEVRRSRLGRIAARLGEREEASRTSAWLGEREGSGGRGWHSMERAMIHALLGERDTALHLIRRAIGDGHGFYSWLHTRPELEPLRGWEPFDRLMRPKG